jgi:hypothetical protein
VQRHRVSADEAELLGLYARFEAEAEVPVMLALALTSGL